jgi:hypothetical protein
LIEADRKRRDGIETQHLVRANLVNRIPLSVGRLPVDKGCARIGIDHPQFLNAEARIKPRFGAAILRNGGAGAISIANKTSPPRTSSERSRRG